MTNFYSIQSARNEACWMPRCLENIIDKKVEGLALSIFEKIADFFCSFLWCGYQRLYQAKIAMVGVSFPRLRLGLFRPSQIRHRLNLSVNTSFSRCLESRGITSNPSRPVVPIRVRSAPLTQSSCTIPRDYRRQIKEANMHRIRRSSPRVEIPVLLRDRHR